MLPLAALLGCQPQPLTNQALSPVTSWLGPIPLPAGPVPQHPWATRACKPGVREPEVLACVNGATIEQKRFLDMQKTQPKDTQPRAILQALIDEELLAQAAAKVLWGDWLQPVLRQQMVVHLLENQFEKNFGPAQITDADLKQAWSHKAIRHTYDRPAVYSVTDAQIICCSGDWKQCEDSAAARKCTDEMEPTAKALAEFLNKNPPQTAQEMHGRVGSDPRFAKAAVVDLAFFYEPDKPYEEQKGYVIMVKSFTEETLRLKPGQLSDHAVRSQFGWHVIRLEKVAPPSHKKFDDPDVQADLRKNLVEALRDEKVEQLVGELGKASGVELYLERFDHN